MVPQIDQIERIKKLERVLASTFVGREEEARVAILALLTRQHAVFIGEPGTAKSALIHRLAQLVNARFFYYLLSKYTVPDEIVGSIDPVAYRQGRFVRNVRGKLPDVELAFLDEIFKASSETLNTILHIMNERKFVDVDGSVYEVPLWSLFAASNELPMDSELAAFYDRFLLRHFVRRIDSVLLEAAILHNIRNLHNTNGFKISLREIEEIYNSVTQYMINQATAIAKITAQLVIILRQYGIFISDRTATSPQHLPRLIATYSYVYNTDLRKAAITVSKYILPSEEALDAYKKALNDLMPAEIREAEEKLERARSEAAGGNLAVAKRLAAEALQIAQTLFSKPEKLELFKAEVKEIIEGAERLIREISRIEEELKKFKI
ncbi:MAG: AAA family ATPase [Archaeoglobaceae archaeon]